MCFNHPGSANQNHFEKRKGQTTAFYFTLVHKCREWQNKKSRSEYVFYVGLNLWTLALYTQTFQVSKERKPTSDHPNSEFRLPSFSRILKSHQVIVLLKLCVILGAGACLSVECTWSRITTRRWPFPLLHCLICLLRHLLGAHRL